MDKDLSKGLRPSKKDRKEILFGTFEFRNGRNVSVRRGVKWAGAKGTYIGKPSDKKDKRHILLEILFTEIYRFKDIPAKVLYYEHQKSCQTYEGLLKAMFEGYGSGFMEDEYVTVIYFHLRG